MNKKIFGIRRGFTLAEVLITLGIIGVVAAMTIPTLIQNTNSVKFATQFKKDISTLSQAALMAQAQYDTDYASTTVTCGTNKTAITSGDTEIAIGKHGIAGSETLSTGVDASICGILNSTLAGKTYLGLGNEVQSASDSTGKYKWSDDGMKTLDGKLESMHVYSLADGSLVGVSKEAKGCSLEVGASLAGKLEEEGDLADCIGFVDVNGTALPNKETVCETESETELDPTQPCHVTNKASKIGDIFPIVFHDGTVEPASNAAKAVLTRGK